MEGVEVEQGMGFAYFFLFDFDYTPSTPTHSPFSSNFQKSTLNPTRISIPAGSVPSGNLFQLKPKVIELLRDGDGKLAAVNFGGAVSGDYFGCRSIYIRL